jgi:hypothetical protein
MDVITVEGRAVRHLAAERATVRVRIRCEHASQVDGTAEDAAALLREVSVLARAEADAGAATWWGAEPVVTWVEKEWVKPSAHADSVLKRRHVAGAGVQVKFRDFGRMTAFAARVNGLQGAEVANVSWALTESTRDALTAETRRDAAVDARLRAEAYATALGEHSVTLVHLYEEGLRPSGPSGSKQQSGVGARNGVTTSGGTGDVRLHAEQIEVTAVVTADFETT